MRLLPIDVLSLVLEEIVREPELDLIDKEIPPKPKDDGDEDANA